MGVLVLLLLAAAPPLAGAVHEPVFIPLLAGSSLAGLAALWLERNEPRPRLPGLALALGLHRTRARPAGAAAASGSARA